MAYLFMGLFMFSIVAGPMTFIYAIIKGSWPAMLACFMITLPVALYILAWQPPISYVGYLPLICLVLAVYSQKNFAILLN